MVSIPIDFDQDRFWKHVDKESSPNGCWPWTASTSGDGYGQFWVGKHNVGAHRIAFLLTEGEIEDGNHIDHLCRRIRCCNPAHLSPCTPRENAMRSPFTVTSINRAKKRCPQGHLYDIIGKNDRGCTICRGRSQFKGRARKN